MANTKAMYGQVQEDAKVPSKPASHGGRLLQLLDLPPEILRIIVEQVTRTNDLCSVALTNSALYALAIPQIYSKFDIVWPDENSLLDHETGVDALSYGLATLVMSNDISGRSRPQEYCLGNNCTFQGSCCCHVASEGSRDIRSRKHLALYTRTFSLGNGPEHWVRDYLITKEAGKMLGTLVALAIGRMENLQHFVWDMPTGIVRDIWLSLASLGNRNRDYNDNCKLQSIWVRLHNNMENFTSGRPAGDPFTSQGSGLPTLLSGTGGPRFYIPCYPRVQFPTFSVLPPLRSLAVLDIDELSYAEELSVLIARSFYRLKELRIGIALHAVRSSWARSQNGFLPSAPASNSDRGSAQRNKGLLGTLLSRLFDHTPVVFPGIGHGNSARAHFYGTTKSQSTSCSCRKATDSTNCLSKSDDDSHMDRLSAQLSAQDINSRSCVGIQRPTLNLCPSSCYHQQDLKKLALTTLELERVSLSSSLLLRTVDWTRLQSLTILGCGNSERLWKVLWKRFTPFGGKQSSEPSGEISALFGSVTANSIRTPVPVQTSQVEYVLNITKLRTDNVSSALVIFIKDTLASDTLEELFLQRSYDWSTEVTTEQIYKYVIRHHRKSLKKLLVDSEPHVPSSSAAPHSEWCFSKELIICIMNGRMQLRELSLSISHQDWHFFIQRLPEMISLRSLHIRHVFNTPAPISPRERAQQIVNVVALRPELQLCYIAISNRCHEIVETKPPLWTTPTSRRSNSSSRHPPSFSSEDTDSDSSSDESTTAAGNANTSTQNANNSGSDSDTDSASDAESLGTSTDVSDEEVGDAPKRSTFRLREILFFDDKIDIFKARHGRL